MVLAWGMGFGIVYRRWNLIGLLSSLAVQLLVAAVLLVIGGANVWHSASRFFTTLTIEELTSAQDRGLLLQREDLRAEIRVRVEPELQHLLHVGNDEVVQDGGGSRAQQAAQQRQRRIAGLVAGGRGRAVDEEKIDSLQVLPGLPRVPRVGLSVDAEALQRGVPDFGQIADVVPGQEVAGLGAEDGVVVKRDDPAVDPEPRSE